MYNVHGQRKAQLNRHFSRSASNLKIYFGVISAVWPSLSHIFFFKLNSSKNVIKFKAFLSTFVEPIKSVLLKCVILNYFKNFPFSHYFSFFSLSGIMIFNRKENFIFQYGFETD